MALSQSITDLTTEELIERFENDIIFDAHSYCAKFERSQAQKELRRRGRQALGDILNHLKLILPISGDIQTAWGHLLCLIEPSVDPVKSGPNELKDTQDWISWAEKFAS